MMDNEILSSILIYFTAFACMFIASSGELNHKLYDNNAIVVKNKYFALFIICFIFALFGAWRWNVGIDYPQYYTNYMTGNLDRYEPLYKNLNSVLKNLNFHFAFFFGVIAFIQIFCLLFALRKVDYLWPFVIFVLFGGHFVFDWFNGIRQEMASCIAFLGCNFLIQNKFKKYFITILIASGFHISAILLLILYPLFKNGKSKVPNFKIQLIVYLCIAFLTLSRFDIVNAVFPALELFTQIGGMSAYEGYMSVNILHNWSDQTKIGYLFLFLLAINCVVILYYPKLKHYFSNNRFRIYYNLYFWGLLTETLFISNTVLARPFRYFRIYKLVIIAYLLYYLFRHYNSKNLLAFIVVCLILVMGIILVAIQFPYTFIFEVDEA